jgi:hypothetical protein
MKGDSHHGVSKGGKVGADMGRGGGGGGGGKVVIVGFLEAAVRVARQRLDGKARTSVRLLLYVFFAFYISHPSLV